MHVTSFVAALAFTSGANAFFPYLTPAHKPNRKIHVSDSIIKGFTFQGSELPLEEDSALTKVRLRKRSHPKFNKRSLLAKRDNDFKIEVDTPPSQSDSAAVDQDGTDTSYFAEVTIGSDPGEQLLLLLDTGSSALWVMGENCTSSACQIHTLFGADNSKTLEPESGDFNISYQSGSVSGSMAKDQISFAGLTVDMTFGIASVASSDFDDYAMDGIMGLARSSEDTDFAATPFIEVLSQDKTLKANLFGVWLDRASDDDDNGEINFGAPDTTRYTGDLNYIDTNNEYMTMWQIPMDDASVNGNALGFTDKQAVVDTGTTLMFVPPDDAATIFKDIEGATLPSGQDIYQIPCSTTTNISLVFNGVSYSISPKDYVGGTVSGSSSTCYAHIVGVAAVDGDPNRWLLGDTFLKNVYTVFDADNNRVGFGTPSTDAGKPVSSGASVSATGIPSGTATESVPSGTANPLLPVKADTTGTSASPTPDSGDAMGSIGGDAAAGPRGASAFSLAMMVGVLCVLW